MKKFIAYMRVSTKEQGIGLEAQRTIMENYAGANKIDIVDYIQEKESGKNVTSRPGLQRAIGMCRESGATLLVAKLDRLSRDVADVFALKKIKNFSFEVCDMNAEDTLMLGIFATLAQKERELISRRTREAMAALKAQGVKLGNPKASEAMRAINHLGVAKRQADAAEASRHAWNAVRFMPGTLREKADYLNAEGYTTSTGKKWCATSVMRMQRRFTQA